MSDISGISGASSSVSSAAYLATVANAIQSTTALPSVFSNLNLSQTQQQQISQILDNAKNGNTTSSQLQSQIESVLNPQQLSQLKSEQHHGHHHHESQSGNSSDEEAFGITTPTSTSSTQAISEAANSYWAQSQITPQSQT
jgi:hypothetical protein